MGTNEDHYRRQVDELERKIHYLEDDLSSARSAREAAERDLSYERQRGQERERSIRYAVQDDMDSLAADVAELELKLQTSRTWSARWKATVWEYRRCIRELQDALRESAMQATGGHT